MKIARTAYAVAIAAAGALATAGIASAAPALTLGVDKAPSAAHEATPVRHYGYYGPYYGYPSYYGPYYGYPRYYRPYYGYPYGYHYRPRSHGRLFIGTPGFRLGVGW